MIALLVKHATYVYTDSVDHIEKENNNIWIFQNDFKISSVR